MKPDAIATERMPGRGPRLTVSALLTVYIASLREAAYSPESIHKYRGHAAAIQRLTFAQVVAETVNAAMLRDLWDELQSERVTSVYLKGPLRGEIIRDFSSGARWGSAAEAATWTHEQRAQFPPVTRPRSVNVTNRTIATLRSAYRWAVANGLLASSPFESSQRAGARTDREFSTR